jgi:hypothetical protein
MLAPNSWTIQKANDIAHFLEIVECLELSPWASSETAYSITSGLREGKPVTMLEEFRRPSISVLQSALVFVRQLFADKDIALKMATDAYLQHAALEERRGWVKILRKQFNRDLIKPPQFYPNAGISGRQIIELFFYPSGLIHRPKSLQASREFRQFLERFGREQAMMAFQWTMQLIVAHALNISQYMRADFEHWIGVEKYPGPDRVGINDLCGPIADEDRALGGSPDGLVGSELHLDEGAESRTFRFRLQGISCEAARGEPYVQSAGKR